MVVAGVVLVGLVITGEAFVAGTVAVGAGAGVNVAVPGCSLAWHELAQLDLFEPELLLLPEPPRPFDEPPEEDERLDEEDEEALLALESPPPPWV